MTSLTKEGIAAAQAGRWEEAREKFQTAWVKSNSYAVAANLAYVEEHFQNLPRAAELFAFAIRTYPAGEPPEKRAELEGKLEEIRAKVATLVVQVDVSACAVMVNGTAVGKTPITSELFRAPGKQTLRFEKEGYLPETREIVVPPGGRESIVIQLRRAPEKGKPSEPLPMWPAAVGFAVAGAGALLGGGMLIASAVRSGDASDLSARCQGPFGSCNEEGQPVADDIGTFRTVSVVGWVVAGAGLAFAIPYTVAASSGGGRADEARLVVVPMIGPALQGVAVGAAF